MHRNAPTLGEVFSKAKKKRKNSNQAVRDFILLKHGEATTPQTIANYHNDAIATHDPVMVAYIAEFYGLGADDLPDDIRELCARASQALAGFGASSFSGPDDDGQAATFSDAANPG